MLNPGPAYAFTLTLRAHGRTIFTSRPYQTEPEAVCALAEARALAPDLVAHARIDQITYSPRPGWVHPGPSSAPPAIADDVARYVAVLAERGYLDPATS